VSDYRFLRVVEQARVLCVTIERADKRNALSQAVLAEIGAVFRAAAAHPDLCCATLRGAGERCFAAGGDLHEFDRMRSVDDARRIGRDSCQALDAIRHFPVPVIACLNGDALGGGAELAVACDMRIAAASAAIAFVQGTLNISPAWGGGSDLVAIVGMSRALRLLSRAERVGPGEAEALGLIDARGTVEQTFDAFIAEFLAPIRARPAQVMRAFKALARARRDGLDAQALRALELEHLELTWCHPDHWAAHDRVLARMSNG